MLKEIEYLGYYWKLGIDNKKDPVEYVVECYPKGKTGHTEIEFRYCGTHLANCAFNCLRDIKKRLKEKAERGGDNG
jgi:uncharacterized protein (DUF1919 family)